MVIQSIRFAYATAYAHESRQNTPLYGREYRHLRQRVIHGYLPLTVDSIKVYSEATSIHVRWPSLLLLLDLPGTLAIPVKRQHNGQNVRAGQYGEETNRILLRHDLLAAPTSLTRFLEKL